MEDSILISTKTVLGIQDVPSFDTDVITHINSTFSIVTQLGIGPVEGFSIENAEGKWSDLGLSIPLLGLLRTYVFLKVRMLFDPPTTSFHIAAMHEQIDEHEHRLSMFREDAIPRPVKEVVSEWCP